MKSRTLAPSGTFTETAWSTGNWWATWQDGATLIVVTISADLSQVALWRTFDLGGNAGAFPKMWADENRLWLTYRIGGESGTFYLTDLIHGDARLVGYAYGIDPMVLGPGFVAWQSTSDYLIVRQPLDGSGPITSEGRGAPTGLSRILLGQVITVDLDRKVVPGGTRPSWAGDAVAIEVDETAGGPCDLVRRSDGLEARLFAGQESNTPRLATDGMGRYLLGTWGKQGVRVALIEAADFVAPVPAPVPVPVPVPTPIPTPSPTPPPTEKPVQLVGVPQDITARSFTRLRNFCHSYVAPDGSQPYLHDASPDDPGSFSDGIFWFVFQTWAPIMVSPPDPANAAGWIARADQADAALERYMRARVGDNPQ